MFQQNTQDTVGRIAEPVDFKIKKGKLKIMPVSDSPWAPTGFGTNTKNIACLLSKEGHHIGYGGCQNSTHAKWSTPWPLGQTETEATMELLPLMYPGQEKFGEKSFPNWVGKFKPDLVLAHLDFQMFKHMTDAKQPTHVQLPIYNKKGILLNRKERVKLVNSAFNNAQKGPAWKLGCIIPYDGEPSLPEWGGQLKNIDYGVAMSRYGQIGLKKDFDFDSTYIPHGVDTNLFKPLVNPTYNKEPKDKKQFIVGCVARNQHRKNIPRLIKGFAQFVQKNKLSPKQAGLILHMDWNDAMGWKFPDFAARYGVADYLLPPMMGTLDAGQAATEDDMVNIFNMMDVFVLPTAGEGFGIPTLEAMSCGVPICVTNYTTGYELVKSIDAGNEDIPMYPLGGQHNEVGANGRDHLEEEDICERGILIPYKDMWWDTPARAAPQRAIASEVAISEALDYYYNNPDKRLAASKAARKHAIDYYSWDVIGQKWIDWVEKIEKEIKK
jgi:glycosyltransferase involved in cell wall biosynthesis